MNSILILGAGGQGREVVQLIKDINKTSPCWSILGFLDDSDALQGKMFNKIPVLGPLNLLKEDKYNGVYIICAVGSSLVRNQLVERLYKEIQPLVYATLIHPTAVLGDEVEVDEGTIICAHSVITTNVQIGKHVIINYGSTVGHDNLIEDYVTILPGSNISGHVNLRYCSTVGAGSVIIQQMEIGPYSIVGAGAVVTKNVPAHCTVVGVPAKPIKYHH